MPEDAWSSWKSRNRFSPPLRAVKPGGRARYATLPSILEEENAGLSKFPAPCPIHAAARGRVLEKGGIRLQMEEYLELWPHRHGTDGFSPRCSSVGVNR